MTLEEPATFSEDDWAELTGPDKKALKTLGRTTLGFETLAKSPGVGQKSMDALISKGLAVEGETSPVQGRKFKLTDKGRLAVEWIQGRRIRVYPS
jgi:hypothetical protein